MVGHFRSLIAFVAFASILSIGSSAWGAQLLEDLLRGIETAAAIATPLRGDGSCEIDGVKGRKQDRVVILARGGPSLAAPPQRFVAFHDSKLRALALAPGEFHVARDDGAKRATPETALAPTGFTAEDLLPFSRSRCAVTRVADISNHQFSLACEPDQTKSQYALAVYKFDRRTFLPLQVLLYRDSMTNLVRMMRFEDFARVGTTAAPARVVMQDFELRTKDVLTLDWSVAPGDPSAAFDPKSFAAVALPDAAK